VSAKKKKKESRAGLNLAINIVTLSVIFVFIGYLLGQFAVKMLKEQHQNTMNMARTEVAAPVVTAPPQQPTAPAIQPTQQTSPPTTNTGLYRVQVGVFSEKDNADRMVDLLKAEGYEAIIISGPPHRVQTGAFSSEENASRLLDELKKKGFEAIIVR
jgi:cell division septation protein DedD